MHLPKYSNPQSTLITGGSSGIGKAIAIDAVRQNQKIFLIARDQDKLFRVAEELREIQPGSQVAVASASVDDDQQIRTAVQRAQSMHGPIDLLINSAGVTAPGYFQQLTIDDFTRQMEINYLGCVRVIQAVLPGMIERRRGWIVNVSSIAGCKGFFGYTAYCGSKFALNGFSEALREEIAPHQVGISLLCPPDTRTPMLAGEEDSKPIETKRMAAGATVLAAEEVSAAMWSGLKRSRFWIVPGREASWFYRANRWMPSAVDWWLRRVMHLPANESATINP